MFTTDTESKILEYLKEHPGATNGDLRALFKVSSGAISQQIKKLKGIGKIRGNKGGYYLSETYTKQVKAVDTHGGANVKPVATQSGANVKTVDTQEGANPDTSVGANVKTVDSAVVGGAKAVDTQGGANAKTVDTQDGANAKAVDTQAGANVKAVDTQGGANAKAVDTQAGANAKPVDSPVAGSIKTVDSPAAAASPGGSLLEEFCARFKIDSEMVARRHKVIFEVFYPGYEQWCQYRQGHNFYSTPWGAVGRIYDGLIWAVALLSSVLFFKRRWLMFAGLVLVAGVVLYQIFGFKNHGSTPMLGYVEQELTTTKEQLASLQNELASTKEQLAQAQEQNKGNQANQEQLASLQSELAQSQSQQEQQNKDTKALQEQLTNVQNELAGTKEQLVQAQQHSKDTQALQEQLASVQSELAQTKQQAKDTQGVPPPEYIPMSQIIYWTQQGIPSDEIINRINTHHSTYGLLKSDIEYLRNNKVSDEVIKAMLPTGTDLPAATSNQAASAVRQGLVNKVKDFITTKIQNGF